MPLVGGYSKAESYAQITRDPVTYRNAKISEDYIYKETMKMFKLTFWQFFNLLNVDYSIYAPKMNWNHIKI